MVNQQICANDQVDVIMLNEPCTTTETETTFNDSYYLTQPNKGPIFSDGPDVESSTNCNPHHSTTIIYVRDHMTDRESLFTSPL